MFKGMNILYAEDEDFIRENVVEALEFMDINVVSVSNGEEAYNEYLKNKPDLIILDIEMPKLNGLEVAKKIRNIDKQTQIVIATAYTNTEYFLKAVELNLLKYLLKPINLIDLKQTLSACKENLKSTVKLKYFNEQDFYDINLRKLIVNNEEKKLDYHERLFLELLLKYSNEVVSYEKIESNIWEEGMSSAALRSLVRNLRQKVPKDSILNISKTGYKVIVKIN